MDQTAVSLINPHLGGILRYESLQEIKRDIILETPSAKVEVRSLDFQDPAVKALVERIKCARLPWEKKEHLLKLLFMYLKSSQACSQSGAGGLQAEDGFIKQMYNLIQTMELSENSRIDPQELIRHKKKTDELVADFLLEEERLRQLKDAQQKASYNNSFGLVLAASQSRDKDIPAENISAGGYSF